MKTFFPALLVLAMFAAGCMSKSSARKREQQAFQMGQREGAQVAQQQGQAVVFFRGQLRHPRIPWTENMKLSQGLAAADYTGTFTPRSIKVIRQGQVHTVNPQSLLRGLDDPELLPGDIVDVLR